MTTATQTKRLKQRFALWDTDHDGNIKRSDYEKEANKTVRAFGESLDSPAGQQVVSAYLSIWDYLAPKAGIPVNGTMNANQFTSVVDQEMLSGGASGFAKVLRSTIKSIVDLCDTDNDGIVNRQEFRQWGKAIGLPEADSDVAFDSIDTDHDGHLDVDELVNAVRDYHLGTLNVPLLGR